MWEVLVSDYLGTPVEAYDEEGKKVWERNLDIYGRVKTEETLGEKNFILFRFQGQYEDEEIGLYYNRFRYYSPEEGCYTQQDPIGLAGGNPTLYGCVYDTNIELDLLGLFKVWRNFSSHPASFRFHLTMDTLAFGYILPTTGWIRDFNPLETCAARRK